MTDQPLTESVPGQRRHWIGVAHEEIDDLLDDLPGGQSVNPVTRRLRQELFDARRRLPQGEQLAQNTEPDDILYAPAQPVRPAPEKNPEMYWILRKVDVTGLSGVGIIGVCFVAPDGAAAYRWFGGPPQDQPKWESYDNPGTAPFIQISGHSGNTVLIPIQPEPGQ